MTSASLTTGGTETYTVNVIGGIGPFDVALYNTSTGNQVSTNVIVPNSLVGNTISFAISNAGTYTYNAVATDNGVWPYIYVFNSISSTITVTAPVVSSGGVVGTGGSPGVPPPSSGGSSLPSVTIYTSGNRTGYTLTNITSPNSETLSFNNGTKSLHVTVNFITPTTAGITVTNATTSSTYTLSVNNPTLIIGPAGYSYYADLTGISYLPILHTLTLQIYEQPNVVPAAPSTTTVPTTTVATTTVSTTIPTTVLTTVPTTTILPKPTVPPAAATYLIIAVVVIAAIILIILYMTTRNRKGRK